MELTLKRLEDTPSDVGDVYKLLKNQPNEVFKTWGASGRRLDLIEKLLANHATYAILLKDKMVGMIGYQFKAKSYVWGFDNKYWLHTLVDRKHNGKGIATLATKMLIDLISPDETTELFSGIGMANLASIRVKEKLGFEKVGQWKDIVVYRKDLQDDHSDSE